MKHSETILELLSDLIEVNGQRIWSYQVVLEDAVDGTDIELKMVFEQIITQGQRLQEELEVEFVRLAHDLPARGNPKGTILRAWDIVKSSFANQNMTINEFFDTGERALLKAYRYAEMNADVPPTTKKLIKRQKQELLVFYDQYQHLYQKQLV